MLILTRKLDESVMICGTCEVMVLGIEHNRVKLGFVADRGVNILRKELLTRGSPGYVCP